MIARLFLFLFLYSLPVAAVGYGVYRKMIRPKLLEAKGRVRAHLQEGYTCSVCDHYVDPLDHDSVFQYKRWFHLGCLQKLLA